MSASTPAGVGTDASPAGEVPMAAAKKGEGMFATGPYESTIDLVKKARDYALLQHLGGIDPDQYPGHLAIVDPFRLACDHDDDQKARELLRFVFRASDDVYFLPLTEKDGRVSRSFKADKHKEIESAKEEAQKARASLAIKLYLSLPKPEKKPPKATLLLTRTAMLEEIAARWCGTSDETEADELFVFLLEHETLWEEEDKGFLAAVKAGAGRLFPRERLARHILCVGSEGPFGWGPRPTRHSEILHLLVLAWVRTSSGAERVVSDIRITQPLVGSTPGVFTFVEELAESLAEIDSGIQKLLLDMTGNTGEEAVFRARLKRGEICVSYKNLGHVILLFKDKRSFSSQNMEEEWHDCFDALKRRVAGWQKENSTIVTLRFEGWVFGDEPSYEREITLKKGRDCS